MDGGELMTDPQGIPGELLPIGPGASEEARIAAAQPLKQGEIKVPFSATHERPELPE
jgi:hypothetical protein